MFLLSPKLLSFLRWCQQRQHFLRKLNAVLQAKHFYVLSKIVLGICNLPQSLHSSCGLCWQQLQPAPSAYWKISPPSPWSSPCLTPGPIYHTTPHTHSALSCDDVRGVTAGTGELCHLRTLPDDSLDRWICIHWCKGWRAEVRGRSPEGSM